MAKQPTLFNYFTKLKITQSLVEKTLGMTDLPLLSEPNLQQQLVENWLSRQKIMKNWKVSCTTEKSKDAIYLYNDPYTSYYDAKSGPRFCRSHTKN